LTPRAGLTINLRLGGGRWLAAAVFSCRRGRPMGPKAHPTTTEL
jgi:hypothetical protein